MDEEEDDFYAPNGDAQVKSEENGVTNDYVGANRDAHMEDENINPPNQSNDNDDDADEDDEEDDDDDSDIDIITERQDGAMPEPPPQARPFRGIKPELPRTASADPSSAPARTQQQSSQNQKTEPATQPKKATLKDGSKYPEIHSSSIDVNAIPTWGPTGKPITEVDIDADLAEHTKPWRLPGTDQTDYFNYGFDEFTWTQYCLRQQNMTSAINAQKQETKQFEMLLAGQPANGPQPGPMAMGMPGMGDMPPDMMNAMFASMNAQGVSDPSQLDFNSFMQQMQSMGGGPAGPAAQTGYGGQAMQQQTSNQGYGAQQHNQSYQQQQGPQGFGGGTPQPQGQGQPQGFEGYSSQQLAMMQGGNGPPQGPGGGARGRGRGRRW